MSDIPISLKALLETYREGCQAAGGGKLAVDIAPKHSGRAEGFVANRMGDPDTQPALVYLPGLHSDDLIFWPNHAPLSERFAVYGMRYRSRGEPSAEQYARDALEMMNAEGVESAYILGESMGSMPAQWLAANHPERVKGLILAGGFACPPDVVRMSMARLGAAVTPSFALRWVVRYLFYPCLRIHGLEAGRFSPELLCNHAALRGPEQLRALRKRLKMIAGWDFDDGLGGIQCPFVYIYGTCDLTVPAKREAKRYQQRIVGAEIQELRGAPHAVLVLRPDDCHRIIKGFAAKVESKASLPHAPAAAAATRP
jgi:pimeloyl-ACP methyl ester carboxylesterase